ncbi:MAG: DUF1080 domain-containing protein [Chitinophagaceae bacterium]|nr:DUF1080 domain-containing protein [Chitinophagaceae bacterium]MCO5241119.1 DUF1080 domain-containing protein [Chitinophagaceae bacterium]
MKQLKFPSFIPMFAVFFLLSCSDGSKKTDSEDTTPVNASDDGWVSLFNGKDLAGWQVCEGTAPYIVEDGEIVGTTAPDNPNGMLCTVDTFSNFILVDSLDSNGFVGFQVHQSSGDWYNSGISG